MNKDLYEVLGVSKSATSDEIKSAYKKLAMKHHPDRNAGSKESEDKFKEIVSAYEVLSDSQKRQNYDTFGTIDGKAGGGRDPFSDIFSQFGDIFGGFGSMFGNRERNKKGGDLRVKIDLTLNEIIFGTEKKIRYNRNIKCSKCDGIGGSDTTVCRTCNGTGQRVIIQQTPFGRIQQTTSCNECSGEGKTVRNKCHDCHGNGTLISEEIIDAKIPAGALNGMQMTMPGYGNHIKDGQPGDLYIVIEEIPDQNFKREGINLICEKSISISDAVLGTKIKFNSPKGEIEVNIPQGCDSGKLFSVKGQGIPQLSPNGNIYGHGDLYVKVNILIPKILTSEQRDLFEKLRDA